MADAIVQVTTTTPSEDVADAIADALVDERLAACVQVLGPIRSRYRWAGAVDTTTEWQCIAKTTASAAAAAVARIAALHPYDVPEILVTPVHEVSSAGYLDWVAAEVESPGT